MPLVTLEVRLTEELRFRALRCFEDISSDLFFRLDEVKILGFRLFTPVDEDIKLVFENFEDDKIEGDDNDELTSKLVGRKCSFDFVINPIFDFVSKVIILDDFWPFDNFESKTSVFEVFRSDRKDKLDVRTVIFSE
jgi:hypothetical protein